MNEKAVDVSLHPSQFPSRVHCACGAIADGYHEETGEWTCERCGALREFNRLSAWFLENMNEEIREGDLVDNVIRLLSERMVLRAGRKCS